LIFNKELSTKNEIRENHNQDNQISPVKRCLLVRDAGLEPARPLQPRDFKHVCSQVRFPMTWTISLPSALSVQVVGALAGY
jgi:ribose 1,5-bisphosphokinase PhnN